MHSNEAKSNRDKLRLDQIGSVAAAEPVGSVLFFVHIGLIGMGAIGAILLFDTWFLASIGATYITVLTLEKTVAARATKTKNASAFPLVLLLVSLRALVYNGLVFGVWVGGSDIFKMAAVALLVAAAINIFVFHATYFPVICSVVAPMWIGFGAITLLFYQTYGFSDEAVAATLIFLGISPYFYLSLLQAKQRWGALDQARVALTHSQKHDAIGRLVSGVAHDFNNINAITLGAAELLKDATPSERKGLVDEIIKASERGAALSAQLLAFGRSSALEPANHSVSEIFNDMRPIFERLLPENIRTTISYQPDTPRIFADRYQLETALLNLVLNARDAMPDGGTIGLHSFRISLQNGDMDLDIREGQSPFAACISVTDTGSGIPKSIWDQVFDPFFTTKDVGQGSGLGLSMVSGFVQQSGGAVRLKSTEGKGTTVRLILPTPPEGMEDFTIAEKPTKQLIHSHILLVEDEAPLRKILAMQIEARGYEVTTASNGEEAKKLLATGLEPDLLITDIVMPGTVQGHQLAHIARRFFDSIPIIFISGYPNHGASERADLRPPGVMAQKPIGEDRLFSLIQSALS